MTIGTGRRVQAVHVPAGDGTRLAVDIWLPTSLTSAGQRVGAVLRATRYHRATDVTDSVPSDSPPTDSDSGLLADSNYAGALRWNRAGIAVVIADARGTGASFGGRTAELSGREIADYDELIDWIANQPWSNGRVGMYGSSYEGQAAELVAATGNPHLVAVAALFSPGDAYRQLIYPGGCATAARFARWMDDCQLKDGVVGAAERIAEINGIPVADVPFPPPVKPVDGPDGPALLASAVAEHQNNIDARACFKSGPRTSRAQPPRGGTARPAE